MISSLIALGANQDRGSDRPAQTLVAAISALTDAGLPPCRVSRFYGSPCFPAGAGPDYVNAVVECRTELTASEILTVLHGIEADFGRERAQRWGARVLDLDLLAHGDEVCPDAEEQARWRHLPLEQQMRDAPDQLILPHPRLQDRAFVLVPMADIAREWSHPTTGEPLAAMLGALSAQDRDALTPL